MILLVGASASGKTEIGKYLEKEFNIKKVVTYTTRKKRPTEVNDVDYHFITKEQFCDFYDTNFFLETMVYNEEYYGTAKKDFDNNTYLIVDPKGLREYKKLPIHTVAFFLNCSANVRKNRMLKRGDDLVDINRRLKNDELTFDLVSLDEYDYVINTEIKSIEQLAVDILTIYKNHR